MANTYSDLAIKMNFLVKPILKSPLHGLLSSRVALIRFKGRQSGKQFETPVGYNRFGSEYLIGLTETRHRKWWRNYRQPWPMAMKCRGRWLEGSAVYLEPGSDDYREGFQKILNRFEFQKTIYKIPDYDAQQGLTEEQLQVLVDNSSGMVRFTPAQSPS